MPAISIIMNVRNGAATLREAIESALAQTFADWEMIVWDDCSTDDSAAVVRSYDDTRIRYMLSPQATSLGKAREAAIRHANGEWLAFLDQDDVWMPRKLEQQTALTEAPSVGLVYGRTLDFDKHGGERDHDYFHEYVPLPEGNILQELLGRGCFPAMSSAMLRRSAVLEAGGLPEYVRIAPDYFLYLAVCSRYEARAVQTVVCRYRLHAGSMTRVYRQEALAEALQIIEPWEPVAPAACRIRRRNVSTALAVEEMRSVQTFSGGLQRLLRDGSVIWLVGRAFVRAWRTVRRWFLRPYWARTAGAS
jgi:hypothetical protein